MSYPGPRYLGDTGEITATLRRADTIRFFDGRAWLDANAGDYLFVPEGGVHGFGNESGQPASMLLLFVPGAPREDYFETLVAVAKGATMSEQEWTEFFLRHDTYWL
jgi:hypothetical protein